MKTALLRRVKREKPTEHAINSSRRRPAWRRQCLANPGPFSVDVRKRTIVEMPSHIDPFPAAAYEDLRATSAIYHGFVFEPRLENIGVVKNRCVAEQLNLRAREFQAQELRTSSVSAEVCPADFSCRDSSPWLDASGPAARTVPNTK